MVRVTVTVTVRRVTVRVGLGSEFGLIVDFGINTELD